MQRKLLKNVVIRAVDTILPPRCVISGEIVEHQGMISGKSWAGLDFIADPMCKTCGLPFDYDIDFQTALNSSNETLCADCLKGKPEFQTARAVLRYNDASQNLILSFKHGDHMHLVRAFIPWLEKAGGEMLAQADIITPVPLHYWRLVKRRYNQAALISRALAQASRKFHVADLLIRKRVTPPQGHLKFKQRAKNVRRAFAVNSRYMQRLQGAQVVLVDDVYTTGATVRECTNTLLKAGAKRVDVLTLARVLRE